MFNRESGLSPLQPPLLCAKTKSHRKTTGVYFWEGEMENDT
jgi:hypothetical protein